MTDRDAQLEFIRRWLEVYDGRLEHIDWLAERIHERCLFSSPRGSVSGASAIANRLRNARRTVPWMRSAVWQLPVENDPGRAWGVRSDVVPPEYPEPATSLHWVFLFADGRLKAVSFTATYERATWIKRKLAETRELRRTAKAKAEEKAAERNSADRAVRDALRRGRPRIRRLRKSVKR